jgi:RimJ/RimL family protein N-acetyltransferase
MNHLNFFQEVLHDDKVIMQPLSPQDFDNLYQAASDPLIWEQHPNKDRYKKDVFQTFFEGALSSKGAYIVYDQETNEVVGSTRYYDYNSEEKTILIGYTFVQRKYWGKGHNQSMKKLMMEYAFNFVDKIYFHIGEYNKRSRISMERLGGKFTRYIEVAYHGEQIKTNAEYCIEKAFYYKL